MEAKVLERVQEAADTQALSGSISCAPGGGVSLLLSGQLGRARGQAGFGDAQLAPVLLVPLAHPCCGTHKCALPQRPGLCPLWPAQQWLSWLHSLQSGVYLVTEAGATHAQHLGGLQGCSLAVNFTWKSFTVAQEWTQDSFSPVTSCGQGLVYGEKPDTNSTGWWHL